ncbi:MAG: hypothetical protein K0R15_507 [Clostridiales bacterium]|jgi:tRNA dimethylallyltransferase|nr:hypothetical protein [Clostridiales bacterium]
MKKPLIILTGPTAVGKTKLSIDLAKLINAEIISADSMQVYKHMDIGTAKITKEEMDGIKHYLIDEIEPYEEFSVSEFQIRAKEYLEEIYSKGKIPIIVGGTGFYIQSILYDIEFSKTEVKTEYRNQLYDLAKEKGNEFLHSKLKQIDPVSADKINPNNVKRVIRAIEYFEQTKTRISDHNEMQSQNISPYNFIYFVLSNEREVLYDRINKRVDKMIEDGLIDEVKGLDSKGYTKDMVAMKGIGYKEVLEYLEGTISYDDAIEIIKQNSRHYAKRQLTWFKREKEVHWVDIHELKNNYKNILTFIVKIVEEKGII